MSLQQFRNYMALEKKYSAHTVGAYLRDLEQFREFCAGEHGDAPLEDMPYSVIRSWVISQVEGGCTNRSVNRKTASLKAYYRYLVRIGRIPASPLAAHRPLRAEKKVEIPFSVGEMHDLLSQWPEAAGYESVRDRLLVDLLYSTGIRRAELIGIRLADLDMDAGTLRVLGKRNKERVLPLLTGLTPLFHSYLEARETEFPGTVSPWLFLSATGNKMSGSLVYRIINKYLSKVSQKAKRSPHVLRHTFATHLLNQGADLNSVKELLGHASLASTQVYTHNSIAELKRVHLESHPRNKKRDTD